MQDSIAPIGIERRVLAGLGLLRERDSIAPIGIERNICVAFLAFGGRDSIAPIGIERGSLVHASPSTSQIQSHLLVLKDEVCLKTPVPVARFNRTYWY